MIAALCVLRQTDEYSDTSAEDQKEALETLLEYARGAVDDGKDGLEKLWRVTVGYLFDNKRDAPKTVSDTVQTEAEA